jgi:hypothetical protein
MDDEMPGRMLLSRHWRGSVGAVLALLQLINKKAPKDRYRRIRVGRRGQGD